MNFTFAIDVSYSMVDTLPKLREDLKNKISTLLKVGDTISLTYFSGPSQYGAVLSKFKVEEVVDLTTIHTSIDNWLRPIGATAFAPPLQAAPSYAVEGELNVFLFLTDGYNNSSSNSDVMSAVKLVADAYDFKYFVEYGYYCDSNFIAKLAEASGAVVLNAKGLKELSIILERTFTTNHVKKEKVVVETKGAERIYVVDADGSLFIYDASLAVAGLLPIDVPVNTLTICSDLDAHGDIEMLAASMAAIKRGDAKKVDHYLELLNDNNLYQLWQNCYGKQRLNEFYEILQGYIANDTLAKVEKTPIERQSTWTTSVFELFQFLSEVGARVRFESYNKVSKAKDTDVLTTAQAEHLATLKSKKEMDAYLESIKPLTFTPDVSDGYLDMSKLVFNSSRANVSFLVKKEGSVALPENKWGKTLYRTHTFRNYTIIKDGILNIPVIEIDASNSDIYEYLENHNLIQFTSTDGDGLILDMNFMPITRKALIKDLKAEDLAKKGFVLETLKALVKVLNFYNKQVNPKTQEADAEFNEFLKGYGITYNGFNPTAGAVESEDFYMAPSLDIKFKGLSSLPSVDSVLAKIEAGKTLTVAESLMAKGLQVYKAISITDDLLNTQTASTLAEKRKVELAIAQDVFNLILSKGWFTDKSGFDDNIVELPETTCTLDYKDVVVKL